MKHVDIYADGACRGNPGPGGWAAILVCGEAERVISGGEAATTNNRMELMAAISALELLREPCEVMLCSDSKYLTDALKLGWAANWRARGWIKADRKPALNADLWERMLNLTAIHKTELVWVRGHNGHPYNERCDALATAEADKFRR